MKIGLIIERFEPCRGGAEQWTWQFTRWLLSRGHEVHIVSRRFGPSTDPMAIVRHRLEAAESRLGFAAAAEIAVERLTLDVVHDMGSSWRCDVFQPHGGSRRAAFEQNLLLLPAALRPVKRTLSRALPRYREFERLISRQYTADGRVLIALSRMVARDFITRHHVSEERIRLIYNGVDTDRFSPAGRDAHRGPLRRQLGLREHEVLLLIVAHNFRLKGVPSLLRAVGQLAEDGRPVRLAIVGGRASRRWKKFAQQVGAAAATRFLGSVNDPSPYYAAADVYVHPTFYDPCSLVVLEALASGLPVVTSRYNGAGELITPGVEGELIDDPADAGDLAEKLGPMFNEEHRRTLARAARRLALRHTLKHNFQQIETLYRDLRIQHQAA